MIWWCSTGTISYCASAIPVQLKNEAASHDRSNSSELSYNNIIQHHQKKAENRNIIIALLLLCYQSGGKLKKPTSIHLSFLPSFLPPPPFLPSPLLQTKLVSQKGILFFLPTHSPKPFPTTRQGIKNYVREGGSTFVNETRREKITRGIL